MRTIKDPKKKPELRRMVHIEGAQDDDNQSTKSTPPKKRKNAKSLKEDHHSVNDSGSYADKQSDIVSEKSSVLGEDDASDISSLKSTPPKKRNYNRIVKAAEVSLEVNGDVHSTPESTPEKKPKGKKKTKAEEKEAPEKQEPEKKSPKSKKSAKQSPQHPAQSTVKQDGDTKKKSLAAKKKTKEKVVEKQVEDTESKPVKKKPAAGNPRKRKLSGPQRDVIDSAPEKSSETSSTKKLKKPLSKEEEHIELKRQTEELRSDKSDKNNIKDVKNGEIENDKKVKSKPKKTPPKKTAANPKPVSPARVIGNKESHKIETKTVKHEQSSESETDMDVDDESSELETSFESINSHREDNEDLNETKEEESDKPEEKDKENDYLFSTKGEQSIKCDDCGYVSRSKGGHTRHLRKCQPGKFGLEVDSQSKPKLHKCEQCEYTAPKRVMVINHMHMHGIFQCKRCKFRTDIEDTLSEHCALEHKDRSDCKFCKNCNRYVKCSEVPLEKHMEECQGRIPFKCPECSKEFQYESSLKCHVVSHYPDKPKLFSCNQCDYKSNYKANLKKHIRHIHEQRGERSIKCLECDKMFFTEDNMRRHLKLHSEERPYKCDKADCDKAFKTMNGLKLHIVSHQTDRPFPCDFEGCEKSFKTKRSLVLHLNETHQNAPRNYKCTEEGCEMAFYKKSHLDRHSDAHKDNRTHFCTFMTCTKAFRNADSLKVHMLFHQDLKPLKCEHCDYTCRQKASIRFHMKKKHPEFVKNDLASPKSVVTPKAVNESGPKGHTDKSESIVRSAENGETLKDSDNLSTGPPSDSGSSNHANQTSLNLSSKQKLKHEAIGTSVDNDQTVVLKSEASETTAGTSRQNSPNRLDPSNENVVPLKPSSNEIASKKGITNEIPVKKPKKTDMYDFQSEDESEDDMKPGLLRKDYNKDKPPLPPVDARLLEDLKSPQNNDGDKSKEAEIPKKEKKKPGPKPKPKPEKTPNDEPPKVPKKRGRKKKSETQKETDKTADKESDREKETVEKDEDSVVEEKAKSPEKAKPVKRGKSPKGRRSKVAKPKIVEDDEEDEEEEKVVVKKKRGPKKKNKLDKKTEEKAQNVPKKRGRKSKSDKNAESEKSKQIEPENGDATINYSEVESSELFGDSKDSMPEKFGPEKVSDTVLSDKEKDPVDKEVDFSELRQASDGVNSDNEASASNCKTAVLEKVEEKKKSDSESSDIGSDFDEDLKPPPAPRPPPMYDSEDGDIESGPENEDFNTSAMSNEPLRDFESSREISMEISRDFESSREIDDSVKTSEYINSVETSTPKEAIGTPSSANPYKNDSVNNEHENPQSHHSHHSSVPHTPSHNSVPTTPAAHEFQESRSIEHQPTSDRIIKNPVHGQTNDENNDESSMPEVDKDYVGRFFEEIQCNQVQSENQISRMNSIDENSKSQDKPIGTPRSDSGVPSSLNSNQTEGSLQMQSPPTDLTQKRIDLISPERPPEPHYQPRSESVHNRSSERITGVPSYEAPYPTSNPVDPYSSSLPSRNTILRQPEQTKPPSPVTTTPSFMRFAESDAMLQRQRLSTPYDRNLQNLHRIAEAPLGQHNSSSPLLRHVTGREEVFPGTTGVTGSMARNPFHSSWTGQDVRPPHWGHPTYLQQQSGSTTSSLFGGKDTPYLPGRDFMFDPSRAVAERNMFPGLAASTHSQRPDIAHDTFQFDRLDFGSYLGYNTAPSLPVDYTRSAHSSGQKTLDERYRQSTTGVSDYRSLPPTSSTSDMFGVNSTFNFEKFYSRDPVYHSQHIADNTSNPFLPGVPSQHAMFGRDYSRGFYAQNPTYPFMNMNDKNYTSSASAKLGHTSDPVGQQRDLVPVPRPNMAAPDSQLQDPYRHSSMIYNMMNKYF